jgi:HAD superfamily hydrolase (TIGR01509 family)
VSARIGCVLFDVGGVLVELSGIPTMLQWMNGRTDTDGLWRAWLNSSAVRAFERGRIDADSFALQLVEEFGLNVDARQFLEGFTQWPRGPLPGAYELLARVRPGVLRATLSNSNATHWPRFIGDMDFGRHFDHHFASHLIDRIKPDREAFEYVSATVGVTPDRILFVDDNQINVDAAREFGMPAHRCLGPADVHRVLAEHDLLSDPG